MPSTRPTHHYLLWLGLLVLFVGLVYALWSFFPSAAQPAAPALPPYPQDLPPLRTQDKISAQHGFQYLISYTNNGFAPKTLKVKKGETVRFINNSIAVLNLTLTSAQPQTLVHGAYFEYTFEKTGTFTYSDGITKGTITVNK